MHLVSSNCKFETFGKTSIHINAQLMLIAFIMLVWRIYADYTIICIKDSSESDSSNNFN